MEDGLAVFSMNGVHQLFHLYIHEPPTDYHGAEPLGLVRHREAHDPLLASQGERASWAEPPDVIEAVRRAELERASAAAAAFSTFSLCESRKRSAQSSSWSPSGW